MQNLIKWINRKIKQTSKLWYYWIGIICSIEILNITLVKEYAPFGVDIAISILLLFILVHYVSVFYKYMYSKYKNYLETNKSEIFQQLEVFEKRIEEISEKAKEDIESKYTELLLKVADHKLELKNEIREVSDKNVKGLAKIEAIIIEANDKTNKSLDEHFSIAISNDTEKQNKLNANISRMLSDLSVELRAVSKEIVNASNKSKNDLIENAKQSNTSLEEKINIIFSETRAKIDENTDIIKENIETTKETIDSLILEKQREVFIKLENLNEESTNNLKNLLEITNSSVKTRVKDLVGKIDDSISIVNKTIGDEVLTVRNKQSEIIQSIGSLIASEKECQSIIKHSIEQFQNQLGLLQKEVIDEIVKSVSGIEQLQMADRDVRNEVITSKFNHVYQLITRLTETVDNRTDNLEANIAKALSVVAAIEENGTKKGDDLFDMLCKVLEAHSEVAVSAKNLGFKQDETASRIGNLETQMITLNTLVKMLKTFTNELEKKKSESTLSKKEANRIEEIYDAESGMTVFNKFNNDILQHSEMLQSGKKVFSADYDSKGNILLSKNYDKQGEAIIEITYYSNGQVKERKEKVKENGKVVTKTTKFSENGIRLQ